MANQKQRLDQTGIGVHAIIELYDCPYALLNDENYIRNAICRAARASGTHLLELTSHHFCPQGVTALGLLAESHISIHTWPETGYAAADLFTCGRQSLSVAVTQVLIGLFKAGRHSAKYLPRGEGLSFSGSVKFADQNEERTAHGY